MVLSGGILWTAGWAAALAAEAAGAALGSRADAAWLLPAAFVLFGVLQAWPVLHMFHKPEGACSVRCLRSLCWACADRGGIGRMGS